MKYFNIIKYIKYLCSSQKIDDDYFYFNFTLGIDVEGIGLWTH